MSDPDPAKAEKAIRRYGALSTVDETIAGLAPQAQPPQQGRP